MPSVGDRELTKAESTALIERVDRALDRGQLPSWTESIHVVGAARWAIEHGYAIVVDEHDAETMSV